jgi:hypothetical protein
MSEITIKRTYDDFPHIVMSENGDLYQLSYYDKLGRFKPYKIIEKTTHNGSQYYRIDGVRYSEYKLATIEKRVIKRIDLNKKIIKFNYQS